MIDIKLSEDWQLTAAATGDAPLTDNMEGFLQTLKTEALTQAGELFYDEDFGWSLLDFVQAEDTELNKVELECRILNKMSAHTEIQSDSIDILQKWSAESLWIQVRFQLTDESSHQLDISLDRIKVEVIA